MGSDREEVTHGLCDNGRTFDVDRCGVAACFHQAAQEDGDVGDLA